MNIQHMTTNFDPQNQKLLGALSRPPKIALKGTLVPNTIDPPEHEGKIEMEDLAS